jgi:hypothetical protein
MKTKVVNVVYHPPTDPECISVRVPARWDDAKIRKWCNDNLNDLGFPIHEEDWEVSGDADDDEATYDATAK